MVTRLRFAVLSLALQWALPVAGALMPALTLAANKQESEPLQREPSAILVRAARPVAHAGHAQNLAPAAAAMARAAASHNRSAISAPRTVWAIPAHTAVAPAGSARKVLSAGRGAKAGIDGGAVRRR